MIQVLPLEEGRLVRWEGGVAPPTQEVGGAIVWWKGTDVFIDTVEAVLQYLWTYSWLAVVSQIFIENGDP